MTQAKLDKNWQAQEQAKRDHLSKHGLYAADQEHSSCGVGFVAAINGEKSRQVVQNALTALKAVWHRGAVDADGKTGDGAGILLQIPLAFL